jgi:protein-S-isoprenylcysteine O-methyltransferase Ste14
VTGTVVNFINTKIPSSHIQKEEKMVNRKDVQIAFEPIGYIFAVLLFSVILVFIFKELGIENIRLLLPFMPKIIFMIVGIILILLFSFTLVYGMYDLNKNLSFPAKRLIVTGMYKYTRHPIYSGIAFTFIGIGLLYESMGFLFGGILWLFLFYTQAKNEEKHLTDIFKDTYVHYKTATPMFLPNFVRLIESLFR